MTGYERQDEDFQPLTWFRGYPIYTTYLIVVFHVASLVFFSLLGFVLNNPLVIEPFVLSSAAVFHQFKLWQVVTYAFIHPLDANFLNFIIEMALLLMYGRETERFLGRRVFLTLYAVLLLTTPAVVLLISALTGLPTVYLGTFALHFGIFVAFAVIYPSVQIFFGLPTKWIAWTLFAFYSLFFLVNSRGNPTLLPVFWANVLVGYGGVLYAGAGGGPLFLDWLKERFARPAKPSIQPRFKPRRLVETNAVAGNKALPARSGSTSGGELHESIDPILDKIRDQGLASLTHGERAALERARVSLLRKEREG